MKPNRINKILITNRGEIVDRILRAARTLDIPCAVVYADDDRDHSYLHSDVEKHLLKGKSISETFLNHQQLIDLALSIGADAIHPGYGFLSEDPKFASLCQKNGITWIGPSAPAMEIMASKSSSRQAALRSGVPVLEAWSGTNDELIIQSVSFTYPVLIKAAAGGGGRGMRIIRNSDEFASQLESASHEAELFFGNPVIFVEQYIEPARHIEVQVLGDKHGNVIHLWERECTIQRRYQKIIEECPSPTLTDDQRNRLTSSAIELTRHTGYDNAGTAEFLMGENGEFFFIEMNARVQVEHPVTEFVTGVDIVAEQINIAQGFPLSIKQEDVKINGHAIECRIVAEDPWNDFLPSPGRIQLFKHTAWAGIRTDHAIGNHTTITTHYDPMIAKVIAHGSDRYHAISQLWNGLRNTTIHGITTNREFQMTMITDPDYINNQVHTHFIKENSKRWIEQIAGFKSDQDTLNMVAIAWALIQILHRPLKGKVSDPWTNLGSWRAGKHYECQIDQYPVGIRICETEPGKMRVTTGGEEHLAEAIDIHENGLSARIDGHFRSFTYSLPEGFAASITFQGFDFMVSLPCLSRKTVSVNGPDNGKGSKNGVAKIVAPLPGKIMKLMVEPGHKIRKGESVLIIESMKTENQVLAASDFIIRDILVRVGQDVKLNESLVTVETN